MQSLRLTHGSPNSSTLQWAKKQSTKMISCTKTENNVSETTPVMLQSTDPSHSGEGTKSYSISGQSCEKRCESKLQREKERERAERMKTGEHSIAKQSYRSESTTPDRERESESKSQKAREEERGRNRMCKRERERVGYSGIVGIIGPCLFRF